MKICPVCNDSFADQLNFCDIDGARLTREGSAQERNKWWSLIGAGLLVGALVITAASMFFLPKARVSSPIVSSDSESAPAPAAPASSGSSATVAAAPAASAAPESAPADAIIPEVKKKDRVLADENFSGAAPNPKAAALAAEGADKKTVPIEVKEPASAIPNKADASSSTGSADDSSEGAAAKPQPPPDLKKEAKTPPSNAKSSDKDSGDKKKNEEKDKKKGGFLRVFKKIFGKG